jgi:hypothetical protein
MRALQSLSPGSPSLPTSISRRKSLHLPSRADKVVEKVLSILSPLITPTQEPDIRSDLFALAKKAIHVWTYAQTDELKITIQPTLDRESRGEWRSRMFDPPPPSSNDSNAEWDAIPATLPRIYTLFPRVVALKTSSMGDALASLPGSFPEPEQEFSTTEICIHTGTGLAEWSPLVLRGKDEEEQRQEELVQSKLRREIDELSKKLNAGSVRNGEHSRSGSMAQSGSGPQSLTEQWTKAGSGRVFDVDE